MISTAIMIMATVALRSSTLLCELALDRVEYFKKLHAAQALAYYGIAYCQAMQEKKDQSPTLSFDYWPVADGAYRGHIAIEPKKQSYSIIVTVSRNAEEPYSIKVEVGQQKDGWRIINWQTV
jgi:hypothetical protein